ncbi:cytochrome c, class I [Sulfuricurvum kujiense DSM 16994]|uniref:Cytochrome c, class I n=1 Tax=Sulfuricurvum kujiense (strain ATCC BAA-921 / DSM 16994 / JCM 11577 / YK-1) TaxID=709032 RepID=E4U154_SULKY|nr:c-type cytochrome [Sulfuricurvum kujiense]ADR33358.1 cytochrome c, class I [Sulfuricurvum kujiense DSM 16994]
MNKLLSILFTAAGLYASEGYSVYQKHCMKCHAELIEKKEVLKVMHTLKAPPMNEVSNRLRENIVISDDDDDVKRRVTIAFIKDYIEHPSVQYSMCHPMAIEKFGIMPSLKGKLSENERQAVAEWIIDRYKGVAFK